VNRLILKNNWHFIVGLVAYGTLLNPDIEKLMEIYGTKYNRAVIYQYNFGGENLCRDL